MNCLSHKPGLLTLLVALCLILASNASAQKHVSRKPAASSASPNKLVSVKASGTTRYSEKEILGSSGLQLGQDAADGDFKEAAERLGRSGLFSSVEYSFSYSDAGVKVEFRLVDNDKVRLLPARFDNFVWFTDTELHSILEQRVPLFKDSLLPDSGRLADRVTESLQVLLSERNLPGRVDYLRESAPGGDVLTGIVYRVEEVSIRIRNVEFPGAQPGEIAPLERAAHQLFDADYSRSRIVTVAHFDLLPLYLERGYLKAAFGASDARVVSGPGAKPTDAANPAAAKADNTKTSDAKASNEKDDEPNSTDVEVEAIVPVTPGKVYSVSAISWKGNSAVTTDEASHLFHLAVGHPADAVRIVSDTENLTRLYHSRGYMKAEIKPVAQLDDDKSTVQYTMNITEGDLYRMGELEIIGVDTPSKDRLREAWTLREGQPYNAEYTRQFLDDAPRLLPRGLRYSVSVNEELSKKDKVVDVTIHFKEQ